MGVAGPVRGEAVAAAEILFAMMMFYRRFSRKELVEITFTFFLSYFTSTLLQSTLCPMRISL